MLIRTFAFLSLLILLCLCIPTLHSHASSIDTTPDNKPTLNKKRSTVKNTLNEQKEKQKKNETLKLETAAPTTQAADVYIKIPDIEGESERNKSKKEITLKGKKILQNAPVEKTRLKIKSSTPDTQTSTDNSNSTTGGINTISTTPKCSDKTDINSIKKDGICKKDSSED